MYVKFIVYFIIGNNYKFLISQLRGLYLYKNVFHIQVRLCKCVELFRRIRKLRKATISCVVSVCLSFRPHRTTPLPLDKFS